MGELDCTRQPSYLRGLAHETMQLVGNNKWGIAVKQPMITRADRRIIHTCSRLQNIVASRPVIYTVVAHWNVNLFIVLYSCTSEIRDMHSLATRTIYMFVHRDVFWVDFNLFWSRLQNWGRTMHQVLTFFLKAWCLLHIHVFKYSKLKQLSLHF